ncbi:ATP-binding protein, partial [Planctomycetota bacterium]|nr:ATP-binding protein [Planctomycetota bacterium]
MFTQTWRRHWGLEEDPFVQQDADKDPVLPRVPAEAVHSSFDRLFGDPRMPGPGVVFGEKGSGKSGLRLAMRRRLEGEDSAAFLVEYTEFDAFLNEARKADRLPPHGAKTPRRVVERFGLADHLDAILSLGVSRLCHEIADGEHPRARGLVPKQKATLLALASLFS